MKNVMIKNMKESFFNSLNIINAILFALIVFLLYCMLPAFTNTVNADCRSRFDVSNSNSTSLSPYQKGCIFDLAEKAFAEGDLELANSLYLKVADNPETIKRIEEIKTLKKEGVYTNAEKAYTEGNYELALRLYKQIPFYKDAESKTLICEDHIQTMIVIKADGEFKEGHYDVAEALVRDLDTVSAKALKCRIQAAKKQQIYNAAENAVNDGDFDRAVILFSSIPDFSDANVRATLARQKAYEKRAFEKATAEEEYY